MSVIILAIDGGGIRGIIPAYIINQIEKQVGKSCYQLFDIIGGTSTGGILTAGLTTPKPGNFVPFTAKELLDIYKTQGGKIFVPQNEDFAATYYADDGNGNGIEPFLQSTVGASVSLRDSMVAVQALKGTRIKQMFTTAYQVNCLGNSKDNPVLGNDYGPYLFNWYDAYNNGPADNYYVWEAARATSAAPTYFPIALVGSNTNNQSNANQKWVLDGGTMSNNPAVWSFTEAFRLGLAKSLSDITIISIGTGVYTGACGVGIHNNYGDFVPDNGNWSDKPWMVLDMYDLQGYETDGTLLNIILDAVQLVSANQLSSMINAGLTYYRLEPEIPQSLSAMDDISPSNINNLVQAATDYIGKGDGKILFDEVISVLKAGNDL